ncbi:nickel-type superoxide dismutase maturation protease [Catenulispora sp. EB89]|uniref:nickel-type superoxide dismutase maturation protease n=1 Tax=Catenulispora sp. EB89 TaxID=3156257 RepID=UPI003511D8E6
MRSATAPGTARWSVLRVSGPSMAPALRDGDFVVVRGVRPGKIRPGDVVVARHPLRADELLVIKRVDRRESGGWWLLSDNEFVTSDSREFGAVPDELVLARAVLRLRDPCRIARIPEKR